MNELTREIVTQVARENKASAVKNDYDFECKVQREYWARLVSDYGVALKQKALDLWMQFCPEMFDEEGFLLSYDPKFYDYECILSGIAMRILERKIKRTPELWLEEWGDLPIRIAQPQPRLFT